MLRILKWLATKQNKQKTKQKQGTVNTWRSLGLYLLCRYVVSSGSSQNHFLNVEFVQEHGTCSEFSLFLFWSSLSNFLGHNTETRKWFYKFYYRIPNAVNYMTPMLQSGFMINLLIYSALNYNRLNKYIFACLNKIFLLLLLLWLILIRIKDLYSYKWAMFEWNCYIWIYLIAFRMKDILDLLNHI